MNREPSVIFNKSIEPENVARLKPYLNEMSWLIPGWVHELHVNLWDSEESGRIADISVRYDYRYAILNLYSAMLTRDHQAQREAVTHELLHINLGLIANFARDTINELCPESEAPKFNKHLIAMLTERHESATQDLTRAILSKK